MNENVETDPVGIEENDRGMEMLVLAAVGIFLSVFWFLVGLAVGRVIAA